MEKHLDTLFRIAHSANFNTGLQALLLIQHLAAARNLAADRFYRTLYESLLDPRLVTSSKHALYLNLLLRALKNDVDVRRVKAFAKRTLCVGCCTSLPTCGRRSLPWRLLWRSLRRRCLMTTRQRRFPDTTGANAIPNTATLNEVACGNWYV